MTDSIKELGKVESVSFGPICNGIMSSYVALDFGGSCQGFGGYVLDDFDKKKDRRVGSAAGMDWMMQLFQLFDVESLDAMKDKAVYAIRDKPYGKIIGLETPAFDGSRKFIIADWLAAWFPEGDEGLQA
jgi:hypothetical protein